MPRVVQDAMGASVVLNPARLKRVLVPTSRALIPVLTSCPPWGGEHVDIVLRRGMKFQRHAPLEGLLKVQALESPGPEVTTE